ncbi:DUF397 domain-containing protein [Streptomyces sp. NPDC046985]|uniref:DUF397 domain-containing protein n=1 Tax=Streptomyces sp. NPDC046985 TaxID=3155377 RepID=UPI0033F8281E
MPNSPEHEMRSFIWHKSSYSNATGGDCVEVARDFHSVVPVRDSKSPRGPVLLFPARAWAPFLAGVKDQ